MPDTIRRTDYFYTMAADKPGEGARLLRVFRDAGVNLLAFSAFPSQRKSQVDFVPADSAAFLAAAKAAKIRLKPRKTVFLIEGEDRVGAIEEILRRLGEAKINVTAIDAVTTSGGRFGALLWVKQRQMRKASEVLGV
ncbi:MAG TPA: hypothetical protein VLT17_07770 [Gemmatimonadales bacterium]|jgi:hypothetical protein|nr:hypothetical protein [Gemmatimonadales bacterium]